MSDSAPTTDLPLDQKSSLQSLAARWRWAAFPASVWFFSHLALSLAVGLSTKLDVAFHRPFAAVLPAPFVDGLCWWDCAWYRDIAQTGYSAVERTNFWPLFPLLGAGLSKLTGLSVPQALVVVANLASLGGMVIAYRIFQEVADEPSARAALLLWVAYPFSFFQATGYPESLMMLFTAASLLLAHRRKHIAAGGMLGVGMLARHFAVAAGLGLLTAQIQQRGKDLRRLFLSWDVLGLLLPFAVWGLYPLYLYAHFHDPLIFLKAHQNWGAIGWQGIWAYLTGGPFELLITYYVLFSVIPFAGAILLLRKKEWWTLAAFGLGLIGVLYAIGLSGLGRYSASVWPAFLPLGAWLARRSSLLMPIVCLLAILQGTFVYWFAHGYPIN